MSSAPVTSQINIARPPLDLVETTKFIATVKKGSLGGEITYDLSGESVSLADAESVIGKGLGALTCHILSGLAQRAKRDNCILRATHVPIVTLRQANEEEIALDFRNFGEQVIGEKCRPSRDQASVQFLGEHFLYTGPMRANLISSRFVVFEEQNTGALRGCQTYIEQSASLNLKTQESCGVQSFHISPTGEVLYQAAAAFSDLNREKHQRYGRIEIADQRKTLYFIPAAAPEQKIEWPGTYIGVS